MRILEYCRVQSRIIFEIKYTEKLRSQQAPVTIFMQRNSWCSKRVMSLKACGRQCTLVNHNRAERHLKKGIN